MREKEEERMTMWRGAVVFHRVQIDRAQASRNTLHVVRHFPLNGAQKITPPAPCTTKCRSVHNNKCYYNCKSA